jgi:hypothetical protein
MCHCGRWFSRLDNLRQHSSTVHADEEIPASSLAATGTRYQRIVRADRGARQPARARSHKRNGSFSQSQIQPQESVRPVQPVLDTQEPDRRERRRPEPLLISPNVSAEDAAFKQYRNDTPPPDSPISAASPYNHPRDIHRQRAAPYPPVSHTASPVATPTSTTLSTLESPFNSPASSRGSIPPSAYPPESPFPSRRMSMPVPPTPSALQFFDSRGSPIPPSSDSSGYNSPGPMPTGFGVRRDSNAFEDRRRTWHSGIPGTYESSLARDIISPTTHIFARTSLHGTAEESPLSSAYAQQHPARLPSISDILNGASERPGTGNLNTAADQLQQQRTPWTVNNSTNDRRISTDLERTLHERISGRRVAPGQTRSSHGRSISNIETRRWGMVIPNGNPFSGPIADSGSERSDSIANSPRPSSGTWSNRNSGYFGDHQNVLVNPRQHRESFGSSGDSGASDGIVTPVSSVMEDMRPRIVGEGNTGEAEYHPEGGNKGFNHGGFDMGGTLSNSKTNSPPLSTDTYENLSPLQALVSVATQAAKIDS